jgi:hypothetical protein
MKIIGLSVSKCCRDMANGVINESDVAFIIGGTNFTTDDQAKAVANSYKATAWRKCQWAANIFFKFWNEKRILMPRAFMGNFVIYNGLLNISQGIWLVRDENGAWVQSHSPRPKQKNRY